MDPGARSPRVWSGGGVREAAGERLAKSGSRGSMNFFSLRRKGFRSRKEMERCWWWIWVVGRRTEEYRNGSRERLGGEEERKGIAKGRAG